MIDVVITATLLWLLRVSLTDIISSLAEVVISKVVRKLKAPSLKVQENLNESV